MKLYVAGPMTGYPDWNFPAFAAATAALREVGYEVVSPAEVDLELGFDPATAQEAYSPLQWHQSMRRDIEILLGVDGIALLDGWKDSRGANVEVTVGEALGIPVVPVDDFLDLARRYPVLVVPA